MINQVRHFIVYRCIKIICNTSLKKKMRFKPDWLSRNIFFKSYIIAYFINNKVVFTLGVKKKITASFLGLGVGVIYTGKAASRYNEGWSGDGRRRTTMYFILTL